MMHYSLHMIVSREWCMHGDRDRGRVAWGQRRNRGRHWRMHGDRDRGRHWRMHADSKETEGNTYQVTEV